MQRRRHTMCALLVTLLLLCWISSVSHASANDEHSLLSVRDVVLVIIRFLDFPDLKVTRRVCTLLNTYSKISVSLRSSLSLISGADRNRFLECDTEEDLYKSSQISAEWANRWTVIEYEEKYLFVKGISEDEKPRYIGRARVKRKVDVVLDDITLLSGRVWISEPKKDRVLNLHTGEILYFSHTFCVINLPYLVIFQGSYLGLHRWNSESGTVERVSGDRCYWDMVSIDRESARLYLRKSINPGSSKLPLLILPWKKSAPNYGFVDFETDEMRTHDHLSKETEKPVMRQWLESIEPRATCISSNIRQLSVMDPITDRIKVESLIPINPGMITLKKDEWGQWVIGEYDLCCNRRYGLFAHGSICYVFDLQTGEMIGPETKADGWVSEELFHVPDQTQFTVRSVHQPRQDIKCKMVDDEGKEFPMMDDDFIEMASDILYDRRNNKLLSVQWE